ncbi:right-handed parallel beta-helix repeat-containing protein, partial [Candidatus Aerophobetes bacterium]|nr:right-handed parallel beta-helix repeat-containing protein [Candidatus Aerophobetes bacterium]
MKKIYCFLLSLVIFSFLGFTSIGSAQIIEYKVTSGGKSVTLTHDYELDAGSSAHSHIDVSTDPSISSNTQLQGGMDAYIRGQTGDDMADVYMVMEDGDTSQVSTQVTPTHSASISASGSALMGVVRAVSGDSRCFCPFSGNFQAEGTAGGRQANTSSTYSDARADIRVVTHGDANHCCHCFPEDRIYKNQPTSALQQAVEATPDAGPSWVLVDEGQYEGAEIGNKTNLNLCGVWGQEDTTINGRSEGGSTLYVHDSPGFYISGLTIEGGNQTGDEAGELGCGLEARRCENIIIEENTVQNNERAIGVWSSNNAEIGGNTVQNNERAIGVLDSNNTQIVGNTIQNNTLGGIYVEDSSNDTQIEGNTIQNNESGIHVWSSNNTQIKENTVQNSEYGICV